MHRNDLNHGLCFSISAWLLIMTWVVLHLMLPKLRLILHSVNLLEVAPDLIIFFNWAHHQPPRASGPIPRQRSAPYYILSPNLRIFSFLFLSFSLAESRNITELAFKGYSYFCYLDISKSTSLINLVRYVEDGAYYLHDLGDKSRYLREELFVIISTEGISDDNADLESGHWCIIKAWATGKQGN